MSEFKMPSLGADMEAGTLVEWMKQAGDRVERGEVIAAVETQKGAIEIEVFETGVLEKILVEVGQRASVGTVLAVIRAEGAGEPVAPAPALPPVSSPTPSPSPLPTPSPSPAPAPAPAPVATSAVAADLQAAPIVQTAPVAARSPGAPKITPAAMRRALELGIELARVHPGADSVIGLREVEAAAATASPAPEAPVPAARLPREREARGGLDLDEMRKAIAAAMSRSWREIPHYFVSSTLDLSPMLDWLQRENARRSVLQRLHYSAPLIKAAALALKATPVLNGHYGERGFEPSASVNLGIAVAMRGGGLIAPAILDADALDLDTLMERLNDLVARVRGGRLRSSELSASTATISNLGEDTADTLQPIIYPPQVAIIGCGRIAERPWAQDDALSARRTLTVTVGGDHRVSDGRSAANFLHRLDDLLRHPERL
jgi:pyruvate dehydrogenase E2 component (dihydrolipoamide acetyltransferase)